MLHYNVTHLCSLQTFDGDGGGGGGGGDDGDDENSLCLLSIYFLDNAIHTLPVCVI